MHSQLNILPPNTMQPNISDAIDLTFYESPLLLADAVAKSMSIGLADFVLNSDSASKQITNKAVNDTLRLNDWLEIRNAPQSDPWS